MAVSVPGEPATFAHPGVPVYEACEEALLCLYADDTVTVCRYRAGAKQKWKPLFRDSIGDWSDFVRVTSEGSVLSGTPGSSSDSPQEVSRRRGRVRGVQVERDSLELVCDVVPCAKCPG